MLTFSTFTLPRTPPPNMPSASPIDYYNIQDDNLYKLTKEAHNSFKRDLAQSLARYKDAFDYINENSSNIAVFDKIFVLSKYLRTLIRTRSQLSLGELKKFDLCLIHPLIEKITFFLDGVSPNTLPEINVLAAYYGAICKYGLESRKLELLPDAIADLELFLLWQEKNGKTDDHFLENKLNCHVYYYQYYFSIGQCQKALKHTLEAIKLCKSEVCRGKINLTKTLPTLVRHKIKIQLIYLLNQFQDEIITLAKFKNDLTAIAQLDFFERVLDARIEGELTETGYIPAIRKKIIDDLSLLFKLRVVYRVLNKWDIDIPTAIEQASEEVFVEIYSNDFQVNDIMRPIIARDWENYIQNSGTEKMLSMAHQIDPKFVPPRIELDHLFKKVSLSGVSKIKPMS